MKLLHKQRYVVSRDSIETSGKSKFNLRHQLITQCQQIRRLLNLGLSNSLITKMSAFPGLSASIRR